MLKRSWTAEEIEKLQAMAGKLPAGKIAEQLGRGPMAHRNEGAPAPDIFANQRRPSPAASTQRNGPSEGYKLRPSWAR